MQAAFLVYGGDEDPGEWQPTERRERIDHADREQPVPAARDYLLAADIGGHDEAIRKESRHLRDPCRVLDRARADDDACGAVPDQRADLIDVRDAASHLHLGADAAAEHRPDQRGIGAALRGGVEIDDVEVREAEFRPAQRDLGGIGEADLLVVVRSANELHAGAVAEIDRGDGDHRAARVVAASARNR